MKSIIIFDLDGTLALVDHRRHYLQRVDGSKATSEDWRKFYQACVGDEPNEPVIEVLRTFASAGYKIIILSGRSEEVRSQTETWLNQHEIGYDALFMRPEGDFTPDEELKRSWLVDIELLGYQVEVSVLGIDRKNILCVFDDRDKVVKMWREEGIPCFQVAEGDF